MLLVLMLLALDLLLIQLRYSPPAPQPADVPRQEFSAERALRTLHDLLAEDRPRPPGSAAHGRLREQIVEQLNGLGLEPEVQEAPVCNDDGCATVRNILARLPGRADTAVVLAAHYDSVESSPGASDNGVGVAIMLEIARAWLAEPPPRNSLVLLFTDGEEAGLFGAQAFAAEHPWARQVRSAVNLDSRGTSGASLMFETSDGNAALMDLFATAVDRPITNSVFYTIYQTMPNDTDFSVFKRHGMAGFNLAFIGGLPHYHTALDTLENVTPATLQHQGDNALALVRALAETDPESSISGDAVFFDLFAWRVVRFSQSLVLPLTLASLLLLTAVLTVLLRRGWLAWRALIWGLLGWLGGVFASALVAVGLFVLLMSAGVLPGPLESLWISEPLPALVAFWLLGFAVTSLVSVKLCRRAGFWGHWAGTWTWWTLLASLLAVLAPAASYPILLPTLCAGLLALPWVLSGADAKRTSIVVTVPAVLAAGLWFPTLWFLYGGLGNVAFVLIAFLVAVLATVLAPLVASLRGRWCLALPAGAGATAAVCVAVAFTLPTYTRQAPMPLDFVFYQNGDSGQARWMLRTGGEISEAIRQAADIDEEPVVPFPWSGGRFRMRAARAQPLDVGQPELSLLGETAVGEKRRVRILLSSPRGASEMGLLIPRSAAVESITLDGRQVSTRTRPGRDLDHYRFYAVPPAGVELEILLAAGEPVTVIVKDQSSGLPAAGEALKSARSSLEIPFDDGDVTIMSRSVTL